MRFIEYSMIATSRHSTMTITCYQICEILSVLVNNWFAVDISFTVNQILALNLNLYTKLEKNYQFKSLQTGGSRNGPSHILRITKINSQIFESEFCTYLSIPVQSSCGCINILASSTKPNFGARSNFNIEIHTLKRFG